MASQILETHRSQTNKPYRWKVWIIGLLRNSRYRHLSMSMILTKFSRPAKPNTMLITLSKVILQDPTTSVRIPKLWRPETETLRHSSKLRATTQSGRSILPVSTPRHLQDIKAHLQGFLTETTTSKDHGQRPARVQCEYSIFELPNQPYD